MDDIAKFIAILVAVIGVGGTIGGAIIGFIGTLVVQHTLEKRKQKFEKEKQEYQRQQEIKRRKAEKLEELVSLLFEHFYFTTNEKSDKKEKISVHSRVEAIVTVYFHELQQQNRVLFNAALHFSNERSGESKVFYHEQFQIFLSQVDIYSQREFQ